MLHGDIDFRMNQRIVAIDVIGPFLVPSFSTPIGKWWSRKKDSTSAVLKGQMTRSSFTLSSYAVSLHRLLGEVTCVAIVPRDYDVQWVQNVLQEYLLPFTRCVHASDLPSLMPAERDCLVITGERYSYPHYRPTTHRIFAISENTDLQNIYARIQTFLELQS